MAGKWGGYMGEGAGGRRFNEDGVHPTPEGNEFAARRWFEALKSNPTCRGWFWQK
ncbi:MAG TPA: hypothetical protein VEJ63_12260 [Planctomycetota bacterium]|nr:hypothetical protein [Planctomycetota bacterium]